MTVYKPSVTYYLSGGGWGYSQKSGQLHKHKSNAEKELEEIASKMNLNTDMRIHDSKIYELEVVE